ncbi:MAG: Bax inhibitor-1/YccA family protein [Alphaproteobacteria bacterium]|nr:Bax inhibitor-1/YccA family protein [Alphaproteobacteria bacterium]
MNRYVNPTSVGATQVAVDEGLRSHFLRIYNYMASAVLLSGIVAYLIVSSKPLTQAILFTPLRWVFVFAPLAFVFVMSWRFERLSKTALQAMYWAYAVCIGVSFATILYVYTGASVARAFFMAAALFAGLSLYGYTTKSDLSKLSTLLMVGLFVIIGASLVNLFIGSTALQFAVSLMGLVVFLGLTAWDTQRIKDTYLEYRGTAIEGKIAVMDALGLYINFVAIFQFLTSLLGQRDE